MKILAHTINNKKIQTILTEGIFIEIYVNSVQESIAASSNTHDVGPIISPNSYEFNKDAYEGFLEFLDFVESKLFEYGYDFDDTKYPVPSNSDNSYSMYYDVVLKGFLHKGRQFPIRVKITDHIFDDKNRKIKQERYSRKKLTEELDVAYTHTQFIIQSITTNLRSEPYHSYEEIERDFMRILDDVEEYIRNCEVSDAKAYIRDKFLRYRKFVLEKTSNNHTTKSFVFNSIDEFLWYAIQQNVFAEHYTLLRFDEDIDDDENLKFTWNIVYKGKQDNWVAYILDA